MAAALLVAAVVACSPTQPRPATATLRVVSSQFPRTLNPILATETLEAALARLVSDLLVGVDARGEFFPELASVVPTTANGGVSRDGRTVTYHLRSGVRWHDGVPFTSRDVKFTFDAIMNPANDVISRHGYDVVTRVDTPDPLTVVFHLRAPFAPFVATVFGESDSAYGILPAHLLEKERSLNAVAYNAAPVGTGPFKVVRWVRGDRIEYAPNDDYFLGKPQLRRIAWRFVGDENTSITLLRTHEVDWMFEATTNAYKTLRTRSGIRILLTPVNGYSGIMFNTARGPAADLHLRRAIVLALDKARITRDVTGGAAVAATADLPPFTWAYDKNLTGLPYDPAAARRELAAAGYGPNHRLALDVVSESSSASARVTMVQMAAALREIGIDVHPRFQISSLIYAGYGAGGTLARGNYEVALYAWIAGIDPDNSSQLTCANRPPAGYNQSFYCSAAMDAAQRVALGTYARPVRKKAYAEIERLVIEDAPLDILFWPRNVQAISPAFHGFDPNPVNENWNAYRWSM